MSRPMILASFSLAVVCPLAAFAAAIVGDADHDGRLSLAEFLKSRQPPIMRADTDHDGRLSRTEWNTLGITVRNQFLGHGVAASTPHTGRTELFLQLDTDKNNYLTADEIEAGLKARFERLDTNHDGYLDERELDARGFR